MLGAKSFSNCLHPICLPLWVSSVVWTNLSGGQNLENLWCIQAGSSDVSSFGFGVRARSGKEAHFFFFFFFLTKLIVWFQRSCSKQALMPHIRILSASEMHQLFRETPLTSVNFLLFRKSLSLLILLLGKKETVCCLEPHYQNKCCSPWASKIHFNNFFQSNW